MGVPMAERNTREFLNALRAELTIPTVHSVSELRDQAIAAFTHELDAKLRNIQDHETLQITYRVDIVNQNGQIRSGRGYDRHMPEYAIWRKAVFERDKFTCQQCGETKGGLNAHHIKGWAKHPEARFDIDNGITLCVNCHQKKHPTIKIVGRLRKAR